MLSAETVEHQLHVRSYAARLTEFHPGRFAECIAQVLGGVLQFLRIYRDGVECRAFQAADSVGDNNHFVEFFRLWSDGDILFYTLPVDQFDLFFYCLVADGGYDQCIISCRGFQMIDTFFVSRPPVICSFQIDRCKIDDLFFRRYYFPRDHRAALCFCRDRKKYKE